MTNEPDFHALVGDEGSPEELGRLRRAHDLLVAAGPPPELSPEVAGPPAVDEGKVLSFRRRRPATVLALAAALAVVAFFVGYVVADKRTGFDANFTRSMHGIGQVSPAQASLKIGKHDSAGNYPIEMTVSGLPRLPSGGWYELLLSKDGQPTLPCGSFAVNHANLTIRLSVPYDLSELGKRQLFNGWVVTRHVPHQNAAPVVMTT